jgi:hypothetical protein
MPTVVAGPQIGGCGGLRSRSRVVVVGSSVAERSGGGPLRRRPVVVLAVAVSSGETIAYRSLGGEGAPQRQRSRAVGSMVGRQGGGGTASAVGGQQVVGRARGGSATGVRAETEKAEGWKWTAGGW